MGEGGGKGREKGVSFNTFIYRAEVRRRGEKDPDSWSPCNGFGFDFPLCSSTVLQTPQPCNTSPAARAVLPRTSQYFVVWPYYLGQAPVLTHGEGGNLCWTGLFTQSNGAGPLAKQAGSGLSLRRGCPGDLADGRSLRGKGRGKAVV